MWNKITNAVEKYRERIFEALEYIWQNPETGYREWKTSKYLEEQYKELGYELILADNIPGFYITIDTGKEGPCVLVLGELDAVICSSHPNANPETGAVHACGHAVQSATLLGIAAALKEPGMLDGLCGKIKLCAVPAEELVELEFRKQLQEDGEIRYLGGKSEFLARGYFDDVDLALMVHTVPVSQYAVSKKWSGCIVKDIVYKGTAAHAGAAPHKGCNALYAATQGITATNAIRETFRDQDQVRVHPIVTIGGSAVNSIPDKVALESQVRALSIKALVNANEKVNRALCGGAVSLGAQIEINDIFGYAPYKNDDGLIAIAGEVLSAMTSGEKSLDIWPTDPGCTDMGDLATLMPVVHLFAPGAKGKGHGDDYYIIDRETACISSAKWQVGIIQELLKGDGERAKKIVENYKAPYQSKEEFFEFKDKINSNGERITYESDGSVKIKA